MATEVDFENNKTMASEKIDVVGVFLGGLILGGGNVAVDKNDGGPTT